jgi:hypothetical protein
MNQERLRALDQQERAAGQVAQGGLQGYGLGLQTAQGERGLEQSLANLGLSTDQARANFGQSDSQLGLQTDLARAGLSQNAANFGLQREQARESALGGMRGDALNYGNLAGNLANQSATDQARATSMFPSIYDLGRSSGNDAMSYANYDRALQEDALGSQVDQYNYLRDQPYSNLSWLQSILGGAPGGAATTTATQPRGSRTAGALGGAMSGAAAGSAFGPYGTLIGGGIGLLGGLL